MWSPRSKSRKGQINFAQPLKLYLKILIHLFFQFQVNIEPLSGKELVECSHLQVLNGDGKRLINSDKISGAVNSSEYSKKNKLSFLPRPLVVRKQIVFHKKS